MNIKKHLLYDADGKQVRFMDTPNKSGVIKPKYLIMHYTAGASAESSAYHMANPSTNVSAHIVIGRNGSMIQMVPFNLKAWHAGKSRWLNLQGLNSHSIGIELDNVGILKKVGNQYKTSWNKPIPHNEVVEDEHKHRPGVIRGWQSYTKEQLDSALELTMLLREQYKLIDVLGHDDIAPARKIDPGPAFPMDRFKCVFQNNGQNDDEPNYVTTASRLKIRS